MYVRLIPQQRNANIQTWPFEALGEEGYPIRAGRQKGFGRDGMMGNLPNNVRKLPQKILHVHDITNDQVLILFGIYSVISIISCLCPTSHIQMTRVSEG